MLATLLTLALLPAQAGRPLLDVPYVTQTPELCGGAAVAMVLRYWGERQVFPEDFASLVVPAERGIPARALVDAVRGRGWQATVLATNPIEARSQIKAALNRGQPPIALIEVAPRTYHYVVIAGATENEVVVHDPARAPFRILTWETFDRAWVAAGRWTMLVLPPADRVDSSSRTPTVSNADSTRALTPCEALVERGVTLALSDDKAGAEDALVGATRLCPLSAAAWRELAGWRFSQQRFRDARIFAGTAVQLAPADAHARELLATSRYLEGDLVGALHAWEPTGQPRLDVIDIHGAERTHHPVIVAATGLQARQLLTPEAFVRAQRRVQALPSLSGARLRYEPLEGGLARLDLSVNEREAYPRSWLSLGVVGARAAIGHEIKVDVAGIFGAGERLAVSGRWQEERPRVAVTLMAPSPWGLPGVVSFDAMWDRQTYAEAARETRRRSALQVGDWATSWLGWRAGVAIDRFDTRRYLSLNGSAEVRLSRDRIAVAAAAGEWQPTAGAERFGTRTASLAWRSSAEPSRQSWSVVAAVNTASRAAPFAVWEGAGTGSARGGLLRAHSLLRGGVVSGPAFGRSVVRGTIEYSHPVGSTLVGAFAVAAFVDAARAWRRLSPQSSPLLADAGFGLRVRVPGRAEVIRLDMAHGLRGGGATFSAGLIESWPR